MKKPYIFLDAGGTIVFPNFELIAEIAYKYGYFLDPMDLLKEFSYVNYYLDNLLKLDLSLYKEEVIKCIPYTLKRFNLDDKDVNMIFTKAKKKAENQFLWTYTLPEIVRGLKILKEEGYSISVISNSDGTVEDQIKVAGLRKFFDEVFDSGIIGIEKPDPKIFQYTLSYIQVSPEDSIYVGDFMMIDVYGANRIKLGAFHLDPYNLYNSWYGYHVKNILELSLLIVNNNIDIKDERLHPFENNYFDNFVL